MTSFRGIVLAAGTGSRLSPTTRAVSKHLLPVYDKPLIYYPISVLMLAGIREILVITAPDQQAAFQRLLGDGEDWGLRFQYAIQDHANGIAEAIAIGRDFVADANTALVLGDNILYGQGVPEVLAEATARDAGASIFAYPVRDPSQYGVVEFNSEAQPMAIREKPSHTNSRYAIPGFYFYDQHVFEIAHSVQPSERGELEISDVNQEYLRRGSLQVMKLSRGCAWMDAGAPDSILQASNYVQAIERRQGLKIACLEEIAYRKRFIELGQLERLAERHQGGYGDYLRELASESGN